MFYQILEEPQVIAADFYGCITTNQLMSNT